MSQPVILVAPKTLAIGEWEAQVEKYETRWKPRREFPVDIVYGAEEALAKLLFELNKSHAFTPLNLGAIISTRALDALGDVNELALKKGTIVKQERRQTGQAIPSFRYEDVEFDPVNMWPLLDAFEATKWGYVWAGYGDDAAADRIYRTFKGIMRRYPGDDEMVKRVYQACAWKWCMAMKRGLSFTEALREVLGNRDALNHEISKYLSKRPRDDEPRPRGKGGDRRDPKGGNNRWGDDDRKVIPEKEPRRRGRDGLEPLSPKAKGPPTRETGGAEWAKRKREACPDFSKYGVKCKCKAPCKLGKHFCSECGKSGHGAAECRNK